MAYTINVNDKNYTVDVDPLTPVLWVLRDVIGLTGTKYGCGIEVCHACNIWIDGSAEKCCRLPVKEIVGKKIKTVEGLSADGKSHPVQRAWIACEVPQCGYCQSGQVMRAAASLGSKTTGPISPPSSNICACGTYERIRKACQLVGKV